MISNRRQFERLEIPEEAVAIDESGCKLGKVSRVGGGGMTITLGHDFARTLAPGARLRVVVEEASGIRHTVPVEVKYCHGGDLGVEFISTL